MHTNASWEVDIPKNIFQHLFVHNIVFTFCTGWGGGGGGGGGAFLDNTRFLIIETHM